MGDLEERKLKNKESFGEYSYTLIETRKASGKEIPVTYNNEGDINGTCCTHCVAFIDRSPFYGGAYVYPVCNTCLIDIWFIENKNKKDKTMSKRNKKSNVSDINLDWVKFEESVNNGTAKLVAMADQYNSYPADIRTMITEKYQGKIEFRKGRNGGIYFTASIPTPTSVV